MSAGAVATKWFHDPKVIIGGSVAALILIVLASRNGGASPSAFTLQSQQTAAGANIALGAQQTDFNKAALGYMAQQANDSVMMHSLDVNSATRLSLAAFNTMDNNVNVAAQNELQTIRANAGVALNANNNAAYLQAAELQSKTQIALAPIQADLARAINESNNNTALSIANTNVTGQTTLASIRSSRDQSIAQTSADQSTTHDIISNIVPIATAVAGFFI